MRSKYHVVLSTIVFLFACNSIIIKQIDLNEGCFYLPTKIHPNLLHLRTRDPFAITGDFVAVIACYVVTCDLSHHSVESQRGVAYFHRNAILVRLHVAAVV